MKSRLLIVLCLLMNFIQIAAQVKEYFVGRKGNQYTLCRVALPMHKDLPIGLDSLLARALFGTHNTTVRKSYNVYKKRFDEILPSNKESLKKVKRYRDINIYWLGFEEGVFANCIIETKETDGDGKVVRRLKWSFLYDLKDSKLLTLNDVFTLPALSEIGKIKGTKHQMLIKQKDSLILQFMQDHQVKEAVFPIQGNTKVFNTKFLNLLASGMNNANPNAVMKMPSSDVDIDIPVVAADNENTFAVIIANENYQEEVKVEYALNDGETFKQYCQKVLGLPEDNIHIRKDATRNNLIAEMAWMQKVAEAYKGEARFIVFYAGHGIPDEKSGSSYLLPVDGKGTMLETGYSLQQFYNQLGDMPSKGVTVFMDACFSGSKRGDGMLTAARGVAVKAKAQAPQGKMVVFSAAQGDETAYPFKEKEHGLFTYYLLKKLKDTRGNVSLGELGQYVTDQVSRKSIVVNGKSQTPSVSTSASMDSNWKAMKLK